MAVPDFTVATPSPQAATSAILQAGQGAVQAGYATTDAAVNSQYGNDVFSQRTMPQLQSGIGATGQFYSGARQNAEKFASQDFLKGQYDVNSAAQRQLDDLTRQRMYAAVGLIV